MFRRSNVRWILLFVLSSGAILEGCSRHNADSASANGERPGTVNVSAVSSLQASYDALPSTGGTVVIPCGTFSGQHLVISKPHVELSGSGQCSVIDLSGDDSQQPVIVISGKDAYLHDFAVTGQKDGGSTFISIGIANQIPVENVRVERLVLTDAGATSIEVENARQVSIRDNKIYRSRFSGIRLAGRNVGGVSEVLVEKNFIQDPNLSQNAGHSGIQADGDPHSNNVQDLVVSANVVEITDHHGTVGYQLNNVQRVRVVDNRVNGSRPNGEGIAFSGNYVLVENNEVSGAAGAGILFFATKTGYHDADIKKNTAHDNAGQGIALVWGENDVTISNVDVRDNRCFDNGSLRNKLEIQSYRDTGVNNGSVNNVRVRNNQVAGDPETALNLLPPSSGQYDLGR